MSLSCRSPDKGVVRIWAQREETVCPSGVLVVVEAYGNSNWKMRASLRLSKEIRALLHRHGARGVRVVSSELVSG